MGAFKIIYLHLLTLCVPKDLLGFMIVYYSRKLKLSEIKAQEMSVLDFLDKVENLK